MSKQYTLPPEGFDEDMATTSLTSEVKKSSVFDAGMARNIVDYNDVSRLLRELENMEAKIRDAAYDGQWAMMATNLYPETVRELERRGFKVTEKKPNPYADPANHMNYKSVYSREYIVSWHHEETVQ